MTTHNRRRSPKGRVVRVPLVTLVASALILALAGAGLRERLDVARHQAEAERTVTAPNVVTHALAPLPGTHTAAAGRFQFRPHHWLSVTTLRHLPPLPASSTKRYLVFLSSSNGWELIGAVRPDRDGDAQVRFAAHPQPSDVNQVIVSIGTDTADPVPHGSLLLGWLSPASARAGATLFGTAPPSSS